MPAMSAATYWPRSATCATGPSICQVLAKISLLRAGERRDRRRGADQFVQHSLMAVECMDLGRAARVRGVVLVLSRRAGDVRSTLLDVLDHHQGRRRPSPCGPAGLDEVFLLLIQHVPGEDWILAGAGPSPADRAAAHKADLVAPADLGLLGVGRVNLSCCFCGSISWSRAFSILKTVARFLCWERSAWQATMMPVGTWVMLAHRGVGGVHVLAASTRSRGRCRPSGRSPQPRCRCCRRQPDRPRRRRRR